MNVDELRRRVRDEPGSRLFLGLAEELLRRGEREEALAVLEAGLAARPGQVAATVAKARCLIELERPLEAREALDSVLRRDPTHLVASKLAVEVWLRARDLERARASLERYSTLGAADPDLVRLATRLRELEAASAEQSPPAAVAASTAVSAAPASTAAGSTAPASAGALAEPPADDVGLVTVTLGNLYLLQGHRAEAERIFRRILRTDPDNGAARQALARALASGRAGGDRQDGVPTSSRKADS
ncbi:MAG TPA: tetratricopeptide repeat protein [Thermoanaerobaculia bacterium]|nr:tetratricopeptide repeat protein [Thermoanaerobaculia bacterium]